VYEARLEAPGHFDNEALLESSHGPVFPCVSRRITDPDFMKHDVQGPIGEQPAQPPRPAEDEPLGMKTVRDELQAHPIGLEVLNSGARDAQAFSPIQPARETDGCKVAGAGNLAASLGDGWIIKGQYPRFHAHFDEAIRKQAAIVTDSILSRVEPATKE
jgi:hypothetical protein